jgi:hypothetical protein
MLDREMIEKLQKQLPYLPGHQFDFKKVKQSEISNPNLNRVINEVKESLISLIIAMRFQ